MKKSDRMNNLLKIMGYVYENNESKECTENNLRKKFGASVYRDFELFTMGGKHPFAEDMGHNKVLGEGIIRLTQFGIRRYFHLRKEHNMEKLQSRIVIATLILATGAIWSVLRDVLDRNLVAPVGIVLSLAMALLFIASSRI